MLAAIDMPEVEVAAMRSPDTAGTKAAQGHSMPGAIVEIAGVTDGVGIVPTLADRAVPGLGGDVCVRCAIGHAIDFTRSMVGVFS